MTDKLEVTLLPCPFCGGAANLDYQRGNENWPQRWQGKCSNCSISATAFSGSSTWHPIKSEDDIACAQAIAAWNTRHQPTPPSADLVEAAAWMYAPIGPVLPNHDPYFVQQNRANMDPRVWTETPLYTFEQLQDFNRVDDRVSTPNPVVDHETGNVSDKQCQQYPNCPANQVCDWCQIIAPARAALVAQLEAENARLREALKAYAEYCNICHSRGSIIEEDEVTGADLWRDCPGCTPARQALGDNHD